MIRQKKNQFHKAKYLAQIEQKINKLILAYITYVINLQSRKIQQSYEMLKKQQIQNYDNYYPFSFGIPMDFPLNLNDFLVEPLKNMKQEPQFKIQQALYTLKVEAKESEFIKQINRLKTQQKQGQTMIRSTSKPQLACRKTEADSFTDKRNIVPNNINHILAFIQRKSKSQLILKRLLIKYNACPTFTPKRFYCYQSHIKQKLCVHVNKLSIISLFNHVDYESVIFAVEEQVFYNRICRILVCYYLRAVANITVLSSGRVRQTSKKDHLGAQRELLEFVLSIEWEK